MRRNLTNQFRNTYTDLEKNITDLAKIKKELEKCIAEIEALFPSDIELMKAHKQSLDLLEKQFKSHVKSLRSIKETIPSSPKFKQQITIT